MSTLLASCLRKAVPNRTLEPSNSNDSETHRGSLASTEAPQRVLYTNLTFSVTSGEVLVIQGPSGCGKTQLLRSLAALDVLQNPYVGSGRSSVTLDGQTPEQLGAIAWRAAVCYVGQLRASTSTGASTPLKLYQFVQGLASRKGKRSSDGASPM